MSKASSALAVIAALYGTGCGGAGGPAGNADAGHNTDGGDDAMDASSTDAPEVGDPHALTIGFDGGANQGGVSQFAFYPVFFGASTSQAGPRTCHTYVRWDMANEPPAIGNASSPAGRRPAFEYWLQNAQNVGHCEEVLVSFQAQSVDGNNNPKPGETCEDGSTPPCNAPSVVAVRAAFEQFVTANWAADTGYTGTFAFTPWNEPDNPGDAGNGLGKVIPPETDAQYYLEMASLCAQHGCKVAAGDFASNGTWWNDYEWNCADDNIPNMTVTHADGSRWCKQASSKNPGNQLPASYLDRYKNYLALHWQEYPGVADRPAYFAFHAWHDVNDYINSHTPCTDYSNCVTRRLLTSLGGSWGAVKIWDTEVGASQGANLTDPLQACGAAFLMRISALSPRIERIYYTRLYNGGTNSGGELITGGNNPATATLRPAGDVLANRSQQYTPPQGTCP